MSRSFLIPNDVPFEKLALISTPDKPARAGWQFDFVEIARAMQRYDINLPISFGYQGKGIYRRGTHYVQDNNGPYHRIIMHQNLEIEIANETLWHEFRHAIQAERWAQETGKPITSFYRESYQKSKGRWGQSYNENTLEIDARSFAHANKYIKLIKEV